MKPDRIGSEVQRLREMRGLRQVDLAIDAGVSQSEISTLERNLRNPTVDTLRKIVAALGYRLEVQFVSTQICQVAHRNLDQLWCDVQFGKLRCERTDAHGLEGTHFIAAHSWQHSQAGTDRSCEDVDIMIGSYPELDAQKIWNG